ncbi:MAG: DUF4270 family protein [Cytophagales bacterium]|nr:DUF4270 family protein [Cytophagales bacterium]
MKPSKKTITIPNRSIISIRSWWVNAPLLFLLAFLFSCDEDLNRLGFRGEEQQFKVYFADVPVPSSVLWMDSVRTMNYTSVETNRLLFGSYSDPYFGDVQSVAVAQFRPTLVTTFIPNDAVYDSAILQFQYDFYHYGSAGLSDFSFTVHELSTELSFYDQYFANSTANYVATPIGSLATTIDADYFTKEAEDTDKDSTVLAKIYLDNNFGQRLFNFINPEDENFTNFQLFKKQFKGLAFVPNNTDKVVGISTGINSYIRVYYHSGTTSNYQTYQFTTGAAFSKISSDRSSTELSGLTQYHTDFEPASNRYIQSGVGLITKLDISAFYDLIEDYPNVIINSVELSINNIPTQGTKKYPTPLALVMLDENNKFKKLKTKQDTTDYQAFNNKVILGTYINYDLPTAPCMASDGSNLFSLTYSSTNNKYVGYPTLAFQQLYALREKRYPYWAILPQSPAFAKSLNQLVFSKDDLKLRVYYTRPNN